MTPLRIAGAGPAGTSAALAALSEGRAVALYERSRFPRHKVCGEFISSEAGAVLEGLGVAAEFHRAKPARIRRCVLHIGMCTKTCVLPEPAYGLSRWTLDHLLLTAAEARGVQVVRGAAPPEIEIDAMGRSAREPRGNRLFGFKAHFRGPADDAVELFFFDRVYVGINTVEDGVTNVCGLAPESFLRARGFDFDAAISASPALAERLRPLERTMDWIAAGPLRFDRAPLDPARYHAGDALGFVDPFTGTGIVNALITGGLAGLCAARGVTARECERQCREAVARPFAVAAMLRAALRSGWADRLAPLVPASWLFALTRPHGVSPQG